MTGVLEFWNENPGWSHIRPAILVNFQDLSFLNFIKNARVPFPGLCIGTQEAL